MVKVVLRRPDGRREKGAAAFSAVEARQESARAAQEARAQDLRRVLLAAVATAAVGGYSVTGHARPSYNKLVRPGGRS